MPGLPSRDARRGHSEPPRFAAAKMNHRRLARGYQLHPHRSEATVHLAMVNLMTRRLTAGYTPAWRGQLPENRQSVMKR